MKMFKNWWFYIIILFIGCIIIAITLSNNKSVGEKGINKSEFDNIQNGMTMTEVNKIINSNNINNVASSQIERIEDVYGTVYKYKYNGEKKGYAIITYELSTSDLWNGSGMKVVAKENFNLK